MNTINAWGAQNSGILAIVGLVITILSLVSAIWQPARSFWGRLFVTIKNVFAYIAEPITHTKRFTKIEKVLELHKNTAELLRLKIRMAERDIKDIKWQLEAIENNSAKTKNGDLT